MTRWRENKTSEEMYNKVFRDDVIALLIVGLNKSTGVKIQRTVQTKKSIILYDNFKSREKRQKKIS